MLTLFIIILSIQIIAASTHDDPYNYDKHLYAYRKNSCFFTLLLHIF